MSDRPTISHGATFTEWVFIARLDPRHGDELPLYFETGVGKHGRWFDWTNDPAEATGYRSRLELLDALAEADLGYFVEVVERVRAWKAEVR